MTGMQFTSVYTDTMIPTKSFMDSFDVVLLWEDGLTGYSTALGNSVYDYVMGGGNLVLGTWYWQDRSDGGYAANSSYNGGWGNLETIDPIMFKKSSIGVLDAYGEDTVDVSSIVDNPLTQGVDTLISWNYSGGPDSARANTTVVAEWKQRGIFLAYNKPNGRIVAVSITPADIYYYYYSRTERTGDFAKPAAAAEYYEGFYKVWENALLYSAWGGVRVTTAASAQSITTNTIGKAKPARIRKARDGGSGHNR
jgi:hypothetical protein